MFYSSKVAGLLAHADDANRQIGERLALVEPQNAQNEEEFWESLLRHYFLSALKAWEFAFYLHPTAERFDYAELMAHFRAYFPALAKIDLQEKCMYTIKAAYGQDFSSSYHSEHGDTFFKGSFIEAYRLLAQAQARALEYAQPITKRTNCYRSEFVCPEIIKNGLSRKELADVSAYFRLIFNREKALNCKDCANEGRNQYTRCHERPVWVSQARGQQSFYATDDDFFELKPAIELYFSPIDTFSTAFDGDEEGYAFLEEEYEEKLLVLSNFLLPLSRLKSRSEEFFEYEYETFDFGDEWASMRCHFGFVGAIYKHKTYTE